MIYGHGDYSFHQEGIRLNFSTNICPLIDHSGLEAHLREKMHLIGSYPEPDALSLRRMIAEREGISPDNIICTAGATDAIYMIAHMMRGKTARIVQPTFSEYEDACRANNIEIADNPEADTHMVWLCNPNNPIGTALSMDELDPMLRNHPEALFIVDMTYERLTTTYVGRPAELLRYGNAISIHSLTKHWGVPGLRIGYIVLPTAMRPAIRPWPIGSLSIEAGKYMITHEEDIRGSIERYMRDDVPTLNLIALLGGYEVYSSSTNFRLVRMSRPNAPELCRRLAQDYGIAIRDASNFHGLDQHYFRIGSRSKEENLSLIDALRCIAL